MGTISVSLPSDGQTADASDYNTPINTIVNEFNGNIDNANIKTGAAIAGSKLASASVTATQIDFGGTGVGVWWQEIARTTLSSAGDTITVSSIPAKTYLKIIINLFDTGGTIGASLTFNNDTGANYARRLATNDAADTTATGQTSILVVSNNQASAINSEIFIINRTAYEKVLSGLAGRVGVAGAGSAPDRWSQGSKWANTAAQISRVDVTNGGTGDYAIGSEVIILGHN